VKMRLRQILAEIANDRMHALKLARDRVETALIWRQARSSPRRLPMSRKPYSAIVRVYPAVGL